MYGDTDWTALSSFDDRQYKEMEWMVDKRESATTRGIHSRRRTDYDNIGWDNSRIFIVTP